MRVAHEDSDRRVTVERCRPGQHAHHREVGELHIVGLVLERRVHRPAAGAALEEETPLTVERIDEELESKLILLIRDPPVLQGRSPVDIQRTQTGVHDPFDARDSTGQDQLPTPLCEPF